MIFEPHTLTAPLNQFIEAVFHYKNFVPDHSIERVVPTGHLFVIFELDGFVRHTYDNDTLKPNGTFTKVWVSGMHQNYISISAHENSEMFVIQFKPHGAHPFLHIPVQDLNDKVVPAEEVFGNELNDLRESILAVETSAEKFALAEDWLNKRFIENHAPSSDLLTVIEKLQAEPVGNYAKIVEEYPMTQKHLIDQFKKYVGLKPKYYQRIVRFNEIVQQIQRKEKVVWSEIAYRCGYSDQSHFIKEFKHFSGFNPQEFIQNDFDLDAGNFFPLDRQS